jgi:phage terminase small subunit
MSKKARHILGYLNNPNTWDKAAFETAIRAEVEASTGALTASDELLVGTLVITVDSLLTAEINIREMGHTYSYNSGDAPSPWYKIRTEMADKAVKILAELGLVARGRPKLKAKASEVDELFANA